MSTVADVKKSSIRTENYEPYMFEGKETGEVSWLRTESGGDGMLFAGLWRAEPMTVEGYVFEGDETFHVLKGRVTIDVEGQGPVDLGEGDIASFRKGTKAVWHVTEPFQKFFVISG
jgi:uncharacterized cupin superfamily protein